MASQELLSIDKEERQHDPPNALGWTFNALQIRGSDGSTGGALAKERKYSTSQGCQGRSRCNSAPRTAPHRGGGEVQLTQLAEEKVIVCCDEELETSFTYIDENVNLRLASPETGRKGHHRATCSGDNCIESLPELSLLSEEDLSFGESFETSLDQGFVCAVTFLVTGISLVIISYVVPRDVEVDRESVSAREMERLEMESARVGAHLDRCVIAGLCLLTLGGVVLSILLMISMWKGEMYRRKALAYTKRSTKLYGSINLMTRSSPNHSNAHLEVEVEETLT